jgi:surfeit locus 1 family protein
MALQRSDHLVSLRSRWLLVPSFGFFAVVCIGLGIWQVNRLKQRRAENRIALAARAAPPVNISAAPALDTTLIGRRVRGVGHYDHTNDIVLRGRVYNGSPGVEIVTPLVLEGGRRAVLVNRGFMPTPDAVTVQTDSVREFGTVQVEGTALLLTSGGGEPLGQPHRLTWSRLDLKALAARMPYDIAPIYIRQSPNPSLPIFPRRLDPLPIDDGPHLSYAIQWFSFATMAIVFGTVMWRKAA